MPRRAGRTRGRLGARRVRARRPARARAPRGRRRCTPPDLRRRDPRLHRRACCSSPASRRRRRPRPVARRACPPARSRRSPGTRVALARDRPCARRGRRRGPRDLGLSRKARAARSGLLDYLLTTFGPFVPAEASHRRGCGVVGRQRRTGPVVTQEDPPMPAASAGPSALDADHRSAARPRTTTPGSFASSTTGGAGAISRRFCPASGSSTSPGTSWLAELTKMGRIAGFLIGLPVAGPPGHRVLPHDRHEPERSAQRPRRRVCTSISSRTPVPSGRTR